MKKLFFFVRQCCKSTVCCPLSRGNKRKGQHTLLFLSHFLFTAFFFIFIYSRPPFFSSYPKKEPEKKKESTFFCSSFSPPQTTADYSSRNKIDPVECEERRKESQVEKSHFVIFSPKTPFRHHTHHTHPPEKEAKYFFACVIAVKI
jgi:hypothetical protein